MSRVLTYSALFRTALLGSCVLSVGACSIRPDPIMLFEHVERAQADRSRIAQDYVPVNGSLSLPEAIARAIKYNYDSQLSKMETSLQERQLDLALAQMLPKLAVDAGYSQRNNRSASESINARTGNRSLDYSYSEDLSRGTGDIQFSWNLLDIGMSYFQARQQGYRALVALERRRKVVNGIVKSVTETYWRAAAANTALPQLDRLLADAERMLDASRKASERNLQSPLVLLEFQQRIIQVVGELRRLRTDLVSSQIQLASLVNVPSGTRFAFSTSVHDMQPQSTTDIRKLEDISLAMRPELRIEAYQERIDRQEIYKEILRMMPGVGILASGNTDSNSLLFNHHWGELGVRATFNLVNLVNGPRAIAVARSTVEISKERRLALSVATIAQVNLGYQQYLTAVENLGTAKQVSAVGEQMTRVARNATLAGAQSDADRVRHQLTGLVSILERDRAMAQVHSSLADIYAAVGIDLVPVDSDLDDLPSLTRKVDAAIQGWENGRLPDMVLPTATTAVTTAIPLPASSVPSIQPMRQ